MNVQEWREIRQLHASGMPIKAISRHLGISRNTARRAIRLDEPPAPPRRRSAADAFETEIRALLAEDSTITVAQIAERIGWQRSTTALKDRVRLMRAEAGTEVRPVAPETVPINDANLPSGLTEFVGRHDELAAIRELLGTSRLVTLTGVGGVGKTRLAIRTAEKVRRAFADGVRWIELGSLHDPALLVQTLVDRLRLADRSSSRSPDELLVDHLRHKQVLLVLDNCEHLLEKVAETANALLRSCPELRILVTSREALSVSGEDVVVVPPLLLPPTNPGTDTTDSAVALFTARARDVLSDFELTGTNQGAVRRICAQLDGLPLAIELACVRLRVLSLDELADRLDHRLRLLTARVRSGPDRHRSLQATMDWSFDLCTPVERRLWTRASVFADGFTLNAAEEVCRDDQLEPDDVLDGIDGMVSKSLLLREEHHGRVKFRMLETIREYGRSCLDGAQAERLRERHYAYYSNRIDRLVAEWFGERQQQWCDEVRAEHANLRAAFETALVRGADSLRLIGSPWFLWAAGFSFTEHRYWLQRALDHDREPSADRARALATLGLVTTLQGDREAASAALSEGTAAAREIGDPFTLTYNRHEQGLVAFFGGDFDTSERLLSEALESYPASETPRDLIGSLRVHLGLLHTFAGNTRRALEQFEPLRPQCEQAGEKWLLSYVRCGIGLASLMSGDHEEAARHALESLRIQQPFDDMIGHSLTTELLSWARTAQGEHECAATLLGVAEKSWDSVGMQLYNSSHWLDQRNHFQRRCLDELGQTAYRAAWDRGRRMSRDEVFQLVLGEPAAVPAPRAPRNPLSARESEVAALVVDGLTNREIAQRLVISHRTVEGHIERVLNKLGLSRRTEVAQRLGESSADELARTR